MDADASHTAPADATQAAPDPEARARRSAMLIVFLVVFIDLLGFGIVLPLLPLYALELLEPLLPGLDNRPLRGLLLGLLMSSFSAMQFLFAPVWGRLSDRIGRRSILLMGLGASVVFYSLFGIAAEVGALGQLVLSLALLFVARLGAGIAGATISTAQAVIADTTTPEKRSHGMALIGVAFGIGFTFGPLLGFASLLVPLKGAPGFAAATFSLVALLLAVRLLPETWRPDAERRERRLLDWRGLQTALRTPTVGILVLTFFLATFAFGSLESTLSLVNRLLLYGEQDLQSDVTAEAMRSMESTNFLIFAYIGFVLILAQGLLYRRLVKRVGEVAFLRAGIVFMALGLLGACAILLVRHEVDERTTLLLPALGVMTLAVLGFACLTPSVQALISRRSDPSRQGEILGVNQSAAALARILGPLFGLSLFHLTTARFGESLFHLTTSHALPFACSVVLLLLVFLLTLRIHPD